MTDETAWVNEKLQAFADDLAGRDLDLRLFIISDQGTDARDVCIAPPLGGANCASNPAENYYHIDDYVSSSYPLHRLVDNHETWQPLLRPGAALHIATITDDDTNWTLAEFWAEWNALSGVPDTFTYHAVASVTDCAEAADISTVHMELVADTGGVLQDLCDQDFDLAFDGIADGIEQSSISCEWALPEPTAGTGLDLSNVTVTVQPGGGSASDISEVASEGSCGSQDGYVLLSDSVLLCDATCSDLQGDDLATVTVSVGCQYE